MREDEGGSHDNDLADVEVRLSTTIRQYRLKQRMSQADLARAIGVRHTAVSRWELGEATISADALLRLARVFEVPVGALFGDQPDLSANGNGERTRILEFLKLAGTIQDPNSRNALLQVSRVLSRPGREAPRTAKSAS